MALPAAQSRLGMRSRRGANDPNPPHDIPADKKLICQQAESPEHSDDISALVLSGTVGCCVKGNANGHQMRPLQADSGYG
jgi:hypothetical protein